jgi:hypothetical protein
MCGSGDFELPLFLLVSTALAPSGYGEISSSDCSSSVFKQRLQSVIVSLPVGRLRGGDTTLGICAASLRIGLGQAVSGYAAGAHVHGRSPAVVYA